MNSSPRRNLSFTRFASLLVAGFASTVVGGCLTPDPVLPPPPSTDEAIAVERGQRLATGLGACGFCHSKDGLTTSALSGGRLLRDKFGDVQGPNITLASTGIGAWSEADLKKTIRANLRPDGSVIAPDFHKGFEWIADTDVTAITYYLRSLAPVENSVARRELSFIDRNTTGFWDTRVDVRGYIPAISPTFKVEYGQYLTDHVARCGSCHTKPEGLFTSEEYMGGGQEISFDGNAKVAPNITSSTVSGIGSWSESALKQYLLSGMTPEGREIDPNFCPVRFYARASSEEIDAVVAYLRAIPAIN